MLFLIRGLPGSGKSTFAKQLDAVVVEADQFFLKDDVYTYDAAKIGEAHAWCQKRTTELLISQLDHVAVANTFTRRWELTPYYEIANRLETGIIELTINTQLSDAELAARCKHGVPVATITAMRERWEI